MDEGGGGRKEVKLGRKGSRREGDLVRRKNGLRESVCVGGDEEAQEEGWKEGRV